MAYKLSLGACLGLINICRNEIMRPRPRMTDFNCIESSNREEIKISLTEFIVTRDRQVIKCV